VQNAGGGRMTLKEIIDGLKFTIDMFLFDPTTGETYKEPRNDMDKTTIDACKGAIELLDQTRWIPITSRPMTEEEKELYKIHPDYQDDCRIFNCKLPDDGQEVLISVYGVVEIDTFVRDANDGCYFESRNIDEVDAWMPLPPVWKGEK
jgi:hypothetical protein